MHLETPLGKIFVDGAYQQGLPQAGSEEGFVLRGQARAGVLVGALALAGNSSLLSTVGKLQRVKSEVRAQEGIVDHGVLLGVGPGRSLEVVT